MNPDERLEWVQLVASGQCDPAELEAYVAALTAERDTYRQWWEELGEDRDAWKDCERVCCEQFDALVRDHSRDQASLSALRARVEELERVLRDQFRVSPLGIGDTRKLEARLSSLEKAAQAVVDARGMPTVWQVNALRAALGGGSDG